MERTEGWPAGLCLAALAMNTLAALGPGGVLLSGRRRLPGDYLRSEILDAPLVFVDLIEIGQIRETDEGILAVRLGPLDGSDIPTDPWSDL